MLFNSYEFIFLFLPFTIASFFCIGKRCHTAATLWLVLASLFFYGWWDLRYVPLLCASICFNYFVGKRLEHLAAGYAIPAGGHVDASVPHSCFRKSWLAFGIIINAVLLGYFKYTDFFLGTANLLAGIDIFHLQHIVLPLGISFFTFTQAAYLVDAYRGQTRNQTFLTYCEFVTIFPHLIAGPIINHREMIPQFLAERTFHIQWDNVATGLAIFTLGLAKKVLIADKIAPWVNDVYARVDALTMPEAWLGALGYALQLYFDFSGYSEMAIGLGLLINLKFPLNFNSPYQSRSIIDFWRRWHMTLGLWVKNYLYIPLGGSRCGTARKLCNLFLSMLIIGFWHGAGWTYVVWGGLHGCLLIVNHLWRRLHITLPNILCWLLTFGSVVACLVVFRSENFHMAHSILAAMVDFSRLPASINGALVKHLAAVFFLTFVTAVAPHPIALVERYFHPTWRWCLPLAALLLYTITMLHDYTEFLYFQF
ncbi:MBOAT family protein [uncultured Selenomonas sp.]|uniref:MBOAT family O-acyltransferase n=1 Tax=uncultured Selenomonas sp. TaxID=159275 RepID=UPI0025CC5B30|nr:MBOAT family O-acyltransferase [uncultured Selenomonas sp.]